MQPAYLSLAENGQLKQRIEKLYDLLAPCHLCPRECAVDRLNGETGFCNSTDEVLVASSGPHFGEEPPLVGKHGSGTIFLAGCNLGCVFCQNYDISHNRNGKPASTDKIAEMMIQLQGRGCHNINFVTPTHYAPQLIQAVATAIKKGLTVPIVWNCGGYESVDVLNLLEDIVNIYMPDVKYADPEVSRQLSNAEDYPKKMRAAVREMYRQVGTLTISSDGIAETGVLARHLVLPENLAGTDEIMQFLAGLDTDFYVNVMAQYRPCYEAHEHDGISRRLTRGEYNDAVQAARNAGLHRLA